MKSIMSTVKCSRGKQVRVFTWMFFWPIKPTKTFYRPNSTSWTVLILVHVAEFAESWMRDILRHATMLHPLGCNWTDFVRCQLVLSCWGSNAIRGYWCHWLCTSTARLLLVVCVLWCPHECPQGVSSRIPHCKSSVVHFNFSGFNVVVDRCSTWRCDGQNTIGSLLLWINTLAQSHPPDNSQQPAVCCWINGPCQWCLVHNMNSGSLKACHHLVSWKNSNLRFENILFSVCKRGKIPMHSSSEFKTKRRLFCPVVSHCTKNHLIRINLKNSNILQRHVVSSSLGI